MPELNQKINLKNLTRKELEQFIEVLEEKSFRARQLWQWMYEKKVTDFSQMTNISKALQGKLSSKAQLKSLTLDQKLKSSSGTIKYLWELEDGLKIESVYIPEGKRKTLCVSSQVGCTLGCRFCATGKLGFIRNLELYEIVDQIISVQRDLNFSLTNIVMMGMGEPFLNYHNLMKALYIINDGEGIAIGHRKITISTAGVVPKLKQYTEEKHPFKLAISLNGTHQEQREHVMPVTKIYPFDDLLAAAKEYTRISKKRVTFEYVLLHGHNDSQEDANRLLRLLKNIPCKLNIIAYNETDTGFLSPSDDQVKWFADRLKKLNASVTVRLSKGDDIQGACGQLAANNLQ